MARKKEAPPTLTPSSGVACKTCRWYLDATEAGEEPNGQCRRYPPTAVWSEEHGPATAVPWVEPDDFCGEHSPVLS